MKKIEKISWHDEFDDKLTIEDLRVKYVPEKRYRIQKVQRSKFDIDPVTERGGYGTEQEIFMIKGTIKFTFSDSKVTLNAGERAYTPTGKYEMYTEDLDYEYITVLDLAKLPWPEEIQKKIERGEWE